MGPHRALPFARTKQKQAGQALAGSKSPKKNTRRKLAIPIPREQGTQAMIQ
jgi:hypothetical protein